MPVNEQLRPEDQQEQMETNTAPTPIMIERVSGLVHARAKAPRNDETGAGGTMVWLMSG